MCNVFRNAQSPKSLVGPVRTLCSESTSSEFSLAMSLALLLDVGAVTAKSAQKLYPELDGNFSKALNSIFRSRFSLMDRASVGVKARKRDSTRKDADEATSAKMKHEPTAMLISDVWEHAIRYVSAGEDISRADGMNLIDFRTALVGDTLLKKAAKSDLPERHTFILQLLSIVFRHTKTEAEFKYVFESSTLNFVVKSYPKFLVQTEQAVTACDLSLIHI